MLSDLARLYAIKRARCAENVPGERRRTEEYRAQAGPVKDTGATGEELALLYEGLKIVDDLQDEQQAAIASVAG